MRVEQKGAPNRFVYRIKYVSVVIVCSDVFRNIATTLLLPWVNSTITKFIIELENVDVGCDVDVFTSNVCTKQLVCQVSSYVQRRKSTFTAPIVDPPWKKTPLAPWPRTSSRSQGIHGNITKFLAKVWSTSVLTILIKTSKNHCRIKKKVCIFIIS